MSQTDGGQAGIIVQFGLQGVLSSDHHVLAECLWAKAAGLVFQKRDSLNLNDGVISARNPNLDRPVPVEHLFVTLDSVRFTKRDDKILFVVNGCGAKKVEHHHGFAKFGVSRVYERCNETFGHFDETSEFKQVWSTESGARRSTKTSVQD